jgi:hypothetical protein
MQDLVSDRVRQRYRRTTSPGATHPSLPFGCAMDNDHSYMRALLGQTRATPPDYPADMGNSDSDTSEVELSPGAIQREQGSNLAFSILRALVQLGPRQNESSDTHALAS